jgi:hypothetical protein
MAQSTFTFKQSTTIEILSVLESDNIQLMSPESGDGIWLPSPEFGQPDSGDQSDRTQAIWSDLAEFRPFDRILTIWPESRILAI